MKTPKTPKKDFPYYEGDKIKTPKKDFRYQVRAYMDGFKKNPPDIEQEKNVNENPLITAAKNCDLERVNFLLGNNLVNVNIRDELGNTPLIYAVEKSKISNVRRKLFYENENNYILNPRCLDAINSLLRAGADANAANEIGDTALIIASRINNLDVVEILLRVPNIDIFIKDRFNKDFLDYVVRDLENEDTLELSIPPLGPFPTLYDLARIYFPYQIQVRLETLLSHKESILSKKLIEEEETLRNKLLKEHQKELRRIEWVQKHKDTPPINIKDTCAICLDNFTDRDFVTNYMCHHALHQECYTNYELNSKHITTCPYCRANLF